MTRTALVTGGARGIGLAITRRLARTGYRVAVSYRSNRAAAQAVAAELSDRGAVVEIFEADIAEPEQARALPRQVVARFGRLDALINNAGITDDGPFLNMEESRYHRVLRTNVLGTMRVTGAALPYLLAVSEPAVVNVASLGGVVGKEGQVPYTASKGALIGFTQWLARTYSHAGLTVNAVAPGFIETDMTSALTPKMIDHIVCGTALKRTGLAAEVADAVSFLLTRGYVQSTTLRVDGGFGR